MTTICLGRNATRFCPIRNDCYRFTHPTPGRDRFDLPYNFENRQCDLFVTNIPTEEFIRTCAYYLWIRLGRPEGRSEEIWYQAKQSAEAAYGRKRFDDSST